ncbi:WxL domain-containing protein [Companilactobacillus jidongensis]|uniref:WxL domain-containing protein n=1 Tax=Companilactobacillus jidongensis TaxID=2486006 RepID=UPI000F7B14D0|nr:WxL domain-containing protein [Companilactobacillus jidongensis]
MKLSNLIFSTIVSLSVLFMFPSVAQADTTNTLDNSDNVDIFTSNTPDDSEVQTATSNVNVTVVTGLLTLDSVPNFNFGNGASGSTVNLKDNSSDGNIIVDGNSQGTLQVTESRQNSEGKTPGFNLSARLNGFNSNGNQINGFTMTLNSEGLYDDNGDNISTNSDKLTTNKAKLVAGSDQETSVINLAAGSYKAGTIKSSFTDSDSASMYIPKKADTLSKSVKKYESSIVWTLTPTPSVN